MNKKIYNKSPLNLTKVRKNIIQARKEGRTSDLIFFVLSGSFNPIHSMHIEVFELAKSFFEKMEKKVIGGFIAPSSDDYLKAKLGKAAMSLSDRIECCNLSIENSDWLNICTWGEKSSNLIQSQIKNLIDKEFNDTLKGNSVKGVEIMGSDTLVRIFSGMLESNQNYWYDDRQICCVIRQNNNMELEKQFVLEQIVPKGHSWGITFHILEIPDLIGARSGISSSLVRDLIQKKEWHELERNNLASRKVLDFLKNRGVH